MACAYMIAGRVAFLMSVAMLSALQLVSTEPSTTRGVRDGGVEEEGACSSRVGSMAELIAKKRCDSLLILG